MRATANRFANWGRRDVFQGLRIGSVFSGIGGLELGLEWLGVGKTVWQCERDWYARSVLQRHWTVPIYDDICSVARDEAQLEALQCDLLVGGPPCQDVSCAGRGAGMEPGTRSGLWWEYLRIVHKLRPPLVFTENPARSRGRWLPTVTSSLASLGYRWAYVCVRACDLGYQHERDRVFLLAADVDRLRSRQYRWGKTRRRATSIAPDAGERGSLADLEGVGREIWRPTASRSGRKGGEKRPMVERGSSRPGTDREWRRSALPEMGRALHGIPHRMDRLRCLANAVIPEQGATAFEFLAAWAAEQTKPLI